MINSIIINFPTNIGDVVLSLPVLDRLRGTYPRSRITAIVSAYTYDFLARNTNINEVVLFDKRWRIKQKIEFSLSLRKKKYDLMVDLKNSFLPVILRVKARTPFVRIFRKDIHACLRYLSLIDNFAGDKEKKGSFVLSKEEEEKWRSYKLSPSIFIACSSHSSLKRYPYNSLVSVIKELRKDYPLVILGEESDASYYGDIFKMNGVVSLVGETNVSDLFYLIDNYARLVLCVDSGILHISSYLNKPTVAIFGPTSYKVYGPRSDNSVVLLKDDIACSPCGKSHCNFNIECMKIEPMRVVEAVRQLLKQAGN